MSEISYTICVNSKDKLAGGLNNKCSFYIPWSTILPMNDNFKVYFSFQTVSYFYQDAGININTSSASLFCDFSSRSYQYNTSVNGPSNSLGLITRDSDNSNITYNTYNSYPYQNVPKTITRPNNNNLNVTVINNFKNQPLLITTTSNNPVSPDMTPWVFYLEFTPIN